MQLSTNEIPPSPAREGACAIPRSLFSAPQRFQVGIGLRKFPKLFVEGKTGFKVRARRFKIPVATMFDVVAPAAALGYAIGRIGCLISGDGDYGIPTSLPWGMSFPNGLEPTTKACLERGWPASCNVHPTPIYEFLGGVIIAALLWRMATKAMGSGGTHGEIISANLIWTGIARFLVEFIRINPRVFYGLTNAQVVSLLSIVAPGVFLLAEAIEVTGDRPVEHSPKCRRSPVLRERSIRRKSKSPPATRRGTCPPGAAGRRR